jgi:hypothetical protein
VRRKPGGEFGVFHNQGNHVCTKGNTPIDERKGNGSFCESQIKELWGSVAQIVGVNPEYPIKPLVKRSEGARRKVITTVRHIPVIERSRLTFGVSGTTVLAMRTK